MHQRHALFVIGGFGLGNSTRCAALIESLHGRGYLVDVATSANGLWYFREASGVRNLVPIRPIGYATGGARISVAKTLAGLPVLLGRLVFNAWILLRLQRKNKYCFIAVDSEYSAFLARWMMEAPIVAINNVFFTFSREMRGVPTGRPCAGGLFFRLVEWLDFQLQSRLSDLRIAPTLSNRGSSSTDGTVFCPPIVRPGFAAMSRPRDLASALVVVSGSGVGISERTVERISSLPSIKQVKVIGLNGWTNGRMTFLGRQQNIVEFMKEADFIVSNGGFSTISEAILCQRPMLLFPIQDHYEQELNVAFTERLGWGVRASNDGLEADLKRLKALFERGEASGLCIDGAEIAASAIDSFVESLGVASAREIAAHG